MTAPLLADPEFGTLDDLVDLDRYPIDQPTSTSCRGLVSMVRKSLAADGAVTLPGFLTDVAVIDAAHQLDEVRPHVPIRRHSASVYHRSDLEANCPPDDPRSITQEWFAGHATRDMFPPYSAAHRVYASQVFKSFVAACVGETRVFEYADPLAGLVATILPPGGTYPWHYDTNEYVITITVQQPESGGLFEYVPDLRSPNDENFAGLHDILTGADLSPVRRTNPGAGDLQLFCGRYSLHRVTAVSGERDRRVLVLSYANRPGVVGPLDRTRSVYGRVTEAHLIAAESSCLAGDGLIL